MKKLIIAIFVALVLGACSQSAGDKFVGTWTGEAKCKGKDGVSCSYPILEISKNNGGSGYTVKKMKHNNAFEMKDTLSNRIQHYDDEILNQGVYTAVVDGDTLIVDYGILKTSLKLNGKVLEFEGDTLAKQE